VDRFMAAPPSDIDVLLMEGTNLGSDKSCVTESDLETDFEALFRQTKGRVFVTWSAQNIDRTVTLYRGPVLAARLNSMSCSYWSSQASSKKGLSCIQAPQRRSWLLV
jgi:hypothetical protein